MPKKELYELEVSAMKKTLLLKVIVVIALVSFFINGCIEKKTSLKTGSVEKEELAFNSGKLPEDLVMLKGSPEEYTFLTSIFQGLVRENDKGKITGALAEKYEVSKDGLTYLFTIRNNAYWNDEQKITAHDFVQFFSSLLKNPRFNDDSLDCIFGVKEYRTNKKGFDNVAIRALDDSTLQIRLTCPCNCLLNVLSEPEFTLRKLDENSTAWKKNHAALRYTGPFVIGKVSSGGDVILYKNNSYWNKDEVKSETIGFKSLNSREEALACFYTGKIDMFANAPMVEYENLKENEKVHSYAGRNVTALVFNMNSKNEQTQGILKNENFRQAVSFCMNREQMVQSLKGRARSSVSYIPDTVSDGSGGKYSNRVNFKKNAEKDKAKFLMSKVQEQKPKSLKLVYENSIENSLLAEEIVKELKDKDGVEINVIAEGMSKQSVEALVSQGGEYDLALMNFSGEFNGAMAYLNLWTSKNNPFGYKNSEFDMLVEKAKLKLNPSSAMESMRKAEDVLMRDLPFVPLINEDISYVSRECVEDVDVRPDGLISLERASANK